MSELVAVEATLFKVLHTLEEYGLTRQQAVDCISSMQNKGLYFRENKKNVYADRPDHIHWAL